MSISNAKSKYTTAKFTDKIAKPDPFLYLKQYGDPPYPGWESLKTESKSPQEPTQPDLDKEQDKPSDTPEFVEMLSMIEEEFENMGFRTIHGEGESESSNSSTIDENEAKQKVMENRNINNKTDRKVGTKCKRCGEPDCKLIVDSEKEVDVITARGCLGLMKGPSSGLELSIHLVQQGKPSTPFGYVHTANVSKWEVTTKSHKGRLFTQPQDTLDNIDGDKFRMVVTIGMNGKSKVVCAVLDCGSYTSCLSLKMAQSIGAVLYDTPVTLAHAANGVIQISQKTKIKVDFGSYSCDMNFSIINDPKYKSSLILLGSNFLQGLQCVCNFTMNKIFIKGKFAVDLYTDDHSAFTQMERVRSNLIKENGVTVVTTEEMQLLKNQTIHLDINLNPNQASILTGKNVFGRSAHLEHVIINNIFIEKGFNYFQQPVTLTIRNIEPGSIIIPAGKKIFTLFPFDNITNHHLETTPNASPQQNYSICSLTMCDDDSDEDADEQTSKVFVENVTSEESTGEADSAMADQSEDQPAGHPVDGTRVGEEERPDRIEETNTMNMNAEDWDNIFRTIEKNEEDDEHLMINFMQSVKRKREEEEETSANANTAETSDMYVPVTNEDGQEVVIKQSPYKKKVDKSAFDFRYATENDKPFTIDSIIETLKQNTTEEDRVEFPRRLPEALADKMKLEAYKRLPDVPTRTKLVLKEETPEVIRDFEEAKQRRLDYWDKMGKEFFFKTMKFGKSADPVWVKKFADYAWSKRMVYGDRLSHVSRVKFFELVTGRNGRPMKPAKTRHGSAFQKAVCDKMVQLHLDAKIMERASSEPVGWAHVIPKNKLPPEKMIKTIQQLEEADDVLMSKAFRMCIDLSEANKSLTSYSAPLPHLRHLVTRIMTGRRFFCLDLLQFFFQLQLNWHSRRDHTFTSTGSDIINQMTCSSMGGSGSLGACQTVVKCIMQPTGLKENYVDNLWHWDEDYESLFEVFVKVHEACETWGLTLKPSESALLFSTEDGDFQLLGLEVKKNRILIPKAKVQQLAALPRSKKFLVKLISSISYYGAFSTCFADILARIREELRAGGKFSVTPRLERLLYCLLHLLRHNVGLALLSEEQWANCDLCMFVDSSSRAYGAALIAILGGPEERILYPVACHSKQHRRSCAYDSKCSNYAELWGLSQCLLAFHHLIHAKPVAIYCDSSYVVSCFNTLQYADIPHRIRAMVIDSKINYDIRLIHLSGKQNFFSDFLSRFSIPHHASATSRSDYRRLFKFHMEPLHLDQSQTVAFMDQYKEEMVKSSWKQTTDDIQRMREELPNIFSLERQVCAMMGDYCRDCNIASITLDEDSRWRDRQRVYENLMDVEESYSSGEILTMEKELHADLKLEPSGYRGKVKRRADGDGGKSVQTPPVPSNGVECNMEVQTELSPEDSFGLPQELMGTGSPMDSLTELLPSQRKEQIKRDNDTRMRETPGGMIIQNSSKDRNS